MSNIIRELSRASYSRSLMSHDSFASASNNSAYNLDSSLYEINRFANSLPASLVASPYSHHIKFNKSKLDVEMTQIENQLKNLSNTSNFISKIPLFEEESE